MENTSNSFWDSPEFEEIRYKISEDINPIAVGLGFHTLMQNGGEGFIDQLKKDVVGVALAGLPGLMMAQAFKSDAVLFGNVVIILYFENSIKIVELGIQPIEGDNYANSLLGDYCLDGLKNGDFEPEVKTHNLENIDISEDAWSNELTISVSNQGKSEWSRKIILPIGKYKHNIPKFLEGTCSNHRIFELFKDLVGLPDPGIFLNEIVSGENRPETALLNRISHNEQFMVEFLEKYQEMMGYNKRKILIRLEEYPKQFRIQLEKHYRKKSQKTPTDSLLRKVALVSLVLSIPLFIFTPRGSHFLALIFAVLSTLGLLSLVAILFREFGRHWHKKNIKYFRVEYRKD